MAAKAVKFSPPPAIGPPAAGQQPVLMTAAVNGSIAGLGGITAGCHVMEPVFALLTGFVGGAHGRKPPPISDKEVQSILHQMQEGVEKPKEDFAAEVAGMTGKS